MRLAIPLPPAHYERPRPGRGTFYSPHTSTLNEWRTLLTNQMRLHSHEMVKGPVSVEMTISPTETVIQLGPAHGVKRPKGIRADLDNIAKFMLDALQETAYANDSQVVRMAAQFVRDER